MSSASLQLLLLKTLILKKFRRLGGFLKHTQPGYSELLYIGVWSMQNKKPPQCSLFLIIKFHETRCRCERRTSMRSREWIKLLKSSTDMWLFRLFYAFITFLHLGFWSTKLFVSTEVSPVYLPVETLKEGSRGCPGKDVIVQRLKNFFRVLLQGRKCSQVRSPNCLSGFQLPDWWALLRVEIDMQITTQIQCI